MRRALSTSLLAALAILAWIAPSVLAHHRADAGDDPRCADWAAGNAPEGLDLTAVCIAREVIGTYTTPGSSQEPLLPYAGAALVAGMGLALVGVLALRFGGRRVARRLAPETPGSWWVCPACRSVNAEGRDACYACHAPALPGSAGDRMPTAASQEADSPNPGG